MYLEVITPDKRLFEGEVTAVQLPGTAGSFEVLNNHAPLISTLEAGSVRVKNSQGEVKIPVTGGLVEVLNNKVTVLASTAV
ncbi:MAG TPA: ATP synthase F1 subunit epsilon [Cytophagales bacterium]|nr:ATP synthase F1 subunit epsilon [Cytophagales bacterium]